MSTRHPRTLSSTSSPNSKHWYTTSFLQPLPYLVTSQGPENCQLTSSFCLFIFCWCSNSSKFVTKNSNYIRRLFYNSSCCLRQLKSNQNRLNRDGTNFSPGMDASHVYVCAWALARFLSQSYQYPNLSEGTDRVGGQLRGDKAGPFRVWRKVP